LAEALYSLPTAEATGKLSELNPEAVVVGLPRNLDGEETDQTAWLRQWVDGAKKATGLTFYAQDEALTTVEAEKKMANSKSADIDALAASVILQDFLDGTEAERVVL
jgi:putative Holliday junction resolvase